MRCDQGIALEQQNTGELLQYRSLRANTKSPSSSYTQSRDDKHASNCVLRGCNTPAADRQHRFWEPNGVVAAFPGKSCVRFERWTVQIVYELAPVIATIISAHCPGTRARDEFVR